MPTQKHWQNFTTGPLAAASQRQHGMYLVISDEISIFESPERSCSLHFCRLILGGRRDRNHQRRWRLDGVDARRARHVAPPTIMWLICQRRRLPKVAPSQCSIALNAYQNVSKLDQAYIRWTLFSENPGPLYCHCLGEESIKTHIARTILSAYLTNDELRPILLNVVKRINLKLFLTTCI